MTTSTRRIGVVGYGHLGKYLVNAILASPHLELVFVWNRTLSDELKENVFKKHILERLEDCGQYRPDLIVEVAHPSITEQYGKLFISTCDYMIGSPTALADEKLYGELRAQAKASGFGLYVPSGAFWGGEDIRKMADRGTLSGLMVTMRKHPSSFKLNGDLFEKNEDAKQGDDEVILYEGPVKDLCPLAPNNINTMAAAAIAGHNLGFNGVRGKLVSDPKLTDWHIVEVRAEGPMVHGNKFVVETIRRNPAAVGAVTGSATYASFFSSILAAHSKGPGVHLC